jgi:hypothetical protein
VRLLGEIDTEVVMTMKAALQAQAAAKARDKEGQLGTVAATVGGESADPERDCLALRSTHQAR